MWDRNAFITLTYNDANLPPSGSLHLPDFQNFMKRLRKKYGAGIRFYHCGEYGENTFRPHYHACLFNFDFPDKILFKTSNDNRLYTSEILSELWPLGHHLIGDVTFESAAYCARYIMKKVNGEPAKDHYVNIDPETGEVFELKPEYTTMSRRPGIGSTWLQKYESDVFPDDFVVLNGKKMRSPTYYSRQYEISSPDEFRKNRGARVRNAKKHADDNTPARLKVRETVQKARLKMLPRKLEGEEP